MLATEAHLMHDSFSFRMIFSLTVISSIGPKKLFAVSLAETSFIEKNAYP